MSPTGPCIRRSVMPLPLFAYLRGVRVCSYSFKRSISLSSLKKNFMAKLIGGLFGGLSGTLGCLVFMQTKYGTVVRTKSRRIKGPPSAAQQQQRERFRTAAGLLRGLHPLLKLLF